MSVSNFINIYRSTDYGSNPILLYSQKPFKHIKSLKKAFHSLSMVSIFSASFFSV